MSRQRMIRPEFFHDAELAECDPLARLLFIGLWTLADREGRLRDKPKNFKIALLPLDDCDIEHLLGQLENAGSIVRYEADENGCICRYISIPHFTTYQHCHKNEQPSELPEPPKKRSFAGHSGASTVQASYSPGTSTSTSTSTSPPIVPPKGGSENGVFDSAFWPQWPKRHGNKKLARQRFYRLSATDRQRVLTALGHLTAAIDDGRYDAAYIMRAENFVGGQKSYFEEWADGPPLKYAAVTSREDDW